MMVYTAPHPALADVAVEELEELRNKRKHLNHVFIAPWLMMFAWRKRLKKIYNLIFEVPLDQDSFGPCMNMSH
jgi:hypothetical protein